MYKKFLKNQNNSYYTEYKKYRNTLNHAIESAKCSYYTTSLVEERNDIGRTYKKINETIKTKAKNQVLPCNLKNNKGDVVYEPKDIAHTG